MTAHTDTAVARVLATMEATAVERESDETVATGPCARIAMHAQAVAYRDCAALVRHELGWVA